MSEKWQKRGVILSFIIGICAFTFYWFYSAKTIRDSSIAFDKEEFSGKITALKSVKGIVEINIGKNPKTYLIVPYVNGEVHFEDIAYFSDSLHKKKFGDTIYLYNGKKIYKFLFSKTGHDYF